MHVLQLQSLVFSIWKDKRSCTNAVEKLERTQPVVEKVKRSFGSIFMMSVPSPASVTRCLLPPMEEVWWKVHSINFPRLCKMAHEYLCAAATRARSARFFTTRGNVVTCTHSSSKPAKVDMLVFLEKKKQKTKRPKETL